MSYLRNENTNIQLSYIRICVNQCRVGFIQHATLTSKVVKIKKVKLLINVVEKGNKMENFRNGYLMFPFYSPGKLS